MFNNLTWSLNTTINDMNHQALPSDRHKNVSGLDQLMKSSWRLDLKR